MTIAAPALVLVLAALVAFGLRKRVTAVAWLSLVAIAASFILVCSMSIPSPSIGFAPLASLSPAGEGRNM